MSTHKFAAALAAVALVGGALVASPASASVPLDPGNTWRAGAMFAESAFTLPGGVARLDFLLRDGAEIPAGGAFLNAHLSATPGDFEAGTPLAEQLPLVPGVGVTLASLDPGLLLASDAPAPIGGYVGYQLVDSDGAPFSWRADGTLDRAPFAPWLYEYVPQTCMPAGVHDALDMGPRGDRLSDVDNGAETCPSSLGAPTMLEHFAVNTVPSWSTFVSGADVAVAVRDADGGLVAQTSRPGALSVGGTYADPEYDWDVELTPGAYTATWTMTPQVAGFDPVERTARFEVTSGFVADDEVTTETGTPVDVDVLANDDGVELPELVAGSVTPAGAGDATVGEDGVATFAPVAGFVGTASFRYSARTPSPGLVSGMATVTVDVRAADAPVVEPEPPVVEPETPVTPEPERPVVEPVAPQVPAVPDPQEPVVPAAPPAEPETPAVVLPPVVDEPHVPEVPEEPVVPVFATGLPATGTSPLRGIGVALVVAGLGVGAGAAARRGRAAE